MYILILESVGVMAMAETLNISWITLDTLLFASIVFQMQQVMYYNVGTLRLSSEGS